MILQIMKVQFIDNTVAYTPDLSDLNMTDGYDPQTAWAFGATEARDVGSAWAALDSLQSKRTPRRTLAALIS